MCSGDSVRVFPHGSPERAAVGVLEGVTDASSEVASSYVVMVLFDTMPPFAKGGEPPIRMVLINYGLGPWVEPGRGGHYEVESVEAA
jgi:hypothetical protein